MNAFNTYDLSSLFNDLDAHGIDSDPLRAWAHADDWELRRNRQQFALTYPLLAVTLAQKPEIPVHMEIVTAVDRGDPLVETLSRLLGKPKRCLRALRGKGPSLTGTYWMEHPDELLEAISAVLPEKIPKTLGEWEIFRKLWISCGDFGDAFTLKRPAPRRQLSRISRHLFASLCSGEYTATEKRLHRILKGDLQRLSTTKDYFEFVADWCDRWIRQWPEGALLRDEVVPIPVTINAPRFRLRDALLTRYSPMELIRQSERWHSEIVGIAKGEPTMDDTPHFLTWPGLPGLPLEAGNMRLISLTTPAQIQYEGAQLNHCVSTYLELCLRGEVHIVSLRTPAGTSCSTAELWINEDRQGRLTYEVVQHMGHSNTKPDLECMLALTDALNFLKSKDQQALLRELVEFHKGRRKEVNEFLSKLKGEIPAEVIFDVMRRVLKDYERVSAWLTRNWDYVARTLLAESQAECRFGRI